jgi:hypothetical protein
MATGRAQLQLPPPPRVSKGLTALRAELAPEIAVVQARFEAGGPISGILHSPMTMQRFLVGHGLNVAMAAHKIRASLAWREKVGADAVRAQIQQQAFDAAGARACEPGEIPGPQLLDGVAYRDIQAAKGVPRTRELRGFRAAYSHFIFGSTEWDFWTQRGGRDDSPVAIRLLGRTIPSEMIANGDVEGLAQFFMHYGCVSCGHRR